jgi:hypothetical protein
MADLEGDPAPPPPFARNLPSNDSKTQDLRPKICDFFFTILGVDPLFGASQFLGPPLVTPVHC